MRNRLTSQRPKKIELRDLVQRSKLAEGLNKTATCSQLRPHIT